MKNSGEIFEPEIINQVVVIGTSAGGLSALKILISQLKEFRIPVLVVRHISPAATGNAVIDELNKLNTLKCEHAKSGESLKPGHLYLAPSDHHLLIESGQS